MSVVIDASITLSWYFDDEGSPKSEAVMDRVAAGSAIVPAHWRLEVVNSFRTGLRRHRIDHKYRDESLSDLDKLPIEIDLETSLHAWRATLALADHHDLTPYDAAYLELAQRKRLPLATLDKHLGQAARDAGVESLLS